MPRLHINTSPSALGHKKIEHPPTRPANVSPNCFSWDLRRHIIYYSGGIILGLASRADEETAVRTARIIRIRLIAPPHQAFCFLLPSPLHMTPLMPRDRPSSGVPSKQLITLLQTNILFAFLRIIYCNLFTAMFEVQRPSDLAHTVRR